MADGRVPRRPNYSPEALERRRKSNAEWWVKNGAAYRAENREAFRQAGRKHLKIHKDKCAARVKAYQQAFPEKRKASEAKYRKAHPDRVKNANATYRGKDGVKDRERETRKTWTVNNLARLCARSAKRRALKFRATPSWADNEKILAIYDEARRLTATTKIEHHVDHIVPLNSKLVCGLHVHNNLQILIGSENLSKGNRHWPDMF